MTWREVITAASREPYKEGKVSLSAFADKVPVRGKVVAVLRGQVPDRNMEIIPQQSRAVREGDVHEIVMTDRDVLPGGRASQVAYLAFVEFQCGGVLLRGDSLTAGGRVVGELVGFDLSHFPNHMNLVVKGDLRSGEDLGIRVGDGVEFTAVRPSKS